MAKPVWQLKLQEKLDANPMCFMDKTPIVKHVKCLAPGEVQGKPIKLRHLTNYNCFNTCATCGKTIR
jgi:hypothetical protein